MTDTYIKLNNRYSVLIPSGLVNAEMKASKYQIDIMLYSIQALYSQYTNLQSNKEYRFKLNKEGFRAKYFKNSNIKDSNKYLKKYITNTENNLISLKIPHRLRVKHFFSEITEDKKYVYFTIDAEMKNYLIEYKQKYESYLQDKKENKLKDYEYCILVYPSIISKLNSTYSKRLYLLCSEFRKKTDVGVRRKEKLSTLKKKLQVPDSYTPYQMKKQILSSAVEEINTNTDLQIGYAINNSNLVNFKIVFVGKGK